MREFVNIIIYGSCNLNCKYCGSYNTKINSDEIILQLERVFVKYKAEKSAFRVECLGEITLYPKILHWLEAKSREGARIEIVSNGTITYRTEDNRPSALKWIISLDGHTESMNSQRNLKQKIIDKMLHNILAKNADIQTVYFGQSVEEMNNFINYLKEHNYEGFLHIFPLRTYDNKLTIYLDRTSLPNVDFIPNQEYFNHWKYIYENQARNKICDRLNNGYSYYVSESDIKMIKCDCSLNTKTSVFVHTFEEKKKLRYFPCGTCINHYEYNNERSFLVL